MKPGWTKPSLPSMISYSDASPHPDLGLPPAMIVGLDCVTGLQTARILARRKIPVIGLAADPKHFCCQTNTCKNVLVADHTSEDFIRVLEGFGPELPQKAVLYPCTDLSVSLISSNRQRLGQWYHVVLPPSDVVELLLDKALFYAFAQKEGLSIPPTFILNNRKDAERAAEQLTFPCVLKPPVKTPLWQQNVGAKVYKAASAHNFLALYDKCSQSCDKLIVQEWIEGGDANLYSCYGFYGIDSEPIATFVARKIRQWPPLIGSSSLGQECRDDTVLRESVRLFKKVGYRGFGYVELKRDSRSGKYFIIEPNVGRPGIRSAIAEAGGVELIYSKYCYTTGRPLPRDLEQKYTNVKWIYLLRDLRSALYYWRRGELSVTDWWQSWSGPKTYAVFSWMDPAPFVWEVLRSVPNVLRRVIPRKRARRQRLPETAPTVVEDPQNSRTQDTVEKSN